VAADALGVPMAAVTVRSGDTDAAPLSTYGTRASRTAVVSGGAVRLAALELGRRILGVVSAMTGCPVEELHLEEGVVRKKGAASVSVPLADVAEAAYFNPVVRARVDLPELSVTRGYDSPIVYSNACYAVEVEVDVRSGTVSVERITAVEDCGTVINPLVVDGQVRGAAVQGLGGALLEDLQYDDTGQMQSATLMDYRLPRSADIPDIDVHHLASPSPTTLFGAKGMGEAGAIGVPAAIACAVSDALRGVGRRVEKLPLTPERILDLLDAGDDGTVGELLTVGAGAVPSDGDRHV
jgi:carbon-monoxide dehydrogenase large subunit